MLLPAIRTAGLLIALLAPAFAGDDATEIVRQSAQHDQINWDIAHNYTFRERVEDRKSGRTEVKTYETVILYSQPFQRLIARDDKPLSARDQQKEQERFDKEVDKRRRESESGRAAVEEAKDRKKRQELRDEILRAFHFALLGEEPVDGHDAWIIGAEPRSDYKPHSTEGRFLQSIHGKLWIDKAGYEWVKIEAAVIRPAHFGLFLVTLSPGSTIYFEQARINDEVWLPKKVKVEVNGRLVFKHVDERVVADYNDYHRFQTDTRITGVSDPIETATPAPPK
ncbi:MAG TPA: hypothetical protein VMJ34_14535 [Bryobacteraceae bacterium]|nr:hypothetical protein [Bryobacteraceae bacterium]